MSRKRTLGRITFDGDMGHLDEVVYSGEVHIEALDAHTYMIMIHGPDGKYIHLHGQNVAYYESEGLDDLVEIGAPLLYCGHQWKHVVDHTCTQDEHHEGRHRCDCGTTKANVNR